MFCELDVILGKFDDEGLFVDLPVPLLVALQETGLKLLKGT